MVIFWALVIVLCIGYIQFYIFHHFVLKHVYYERKFKQEAVFEHEPCYLEERIENRKRLWIPWLYVESLLDVHLTFGKQENLFVSTGTVYQNHASFFVLRGYSRITRTHSLVPIKRGVYRLNSVTLTSGDLLGFSKKVDNRSLIDERALIVYPKPELPIISVNNQDFSLGETVVKRFIMPDPFMKTGTRQYAPGDAIKHINWQATARSGELQINQFDYTSNKRLMVLINCEDHENMWKTVNNSQAVEAFIRYAAGITQQAIEDGIEAGLACNMPTIDSTEPLIMTPKGGQAYWHSIVDQLARIKTERTHPFHELLESFIYAYSEPIEFIVLSSYWNEQCEYIADRLRAKQHQVYVLPLADASARTTIEGA